MENNIEQGPERIFSKEEVIELIATRAENTVVKKELYDDQGLYYLDTEVQGQPEGESIEYTYTRAGDFVNQNSAKETVISVTYYKNGIPVSGYNAFEYNKITGEWRENHD